MIGRGRMGPLRLFDLYQGARLLLASVDAQSIAARSTSMMDIAMLAIGFVFFALSIGYVYACDRL
jgi:hypothetical protein